MKRLDATALAEDLLHQQRSLIEARAAAMSRVAELHDAGRLYELSVWREVKSILNGLPFETER